MSKYKKGKIVKGTVSGIETYGVFVKLDEYYTGLIHISEISNKYVKNISDYLKIGDIIYTEIIEVDERTTHLKLSIKNINYRPKRNKYQSKITETSLGFKTLAYKLPKWIENSYNKAKKIKF